MKTRSTTSTERADVYRLAALYMEGPTAQFGCCNALVQVAPYGMYSELSREFLRVFRKPRSRKEYLWGEPFLGDIPDRGPRVLALCFMAAMVEAGDA